MKRAKWLIRFHKIFSFTTLAILDTDMIFRHNSRSSLRIFLTFCTQKERCHYTSTLYQWLFTKCFHFGYMGHNGPPIWCIFVTLNLLYRYPVNAGSWFYTMKGGKRYMKIMQLFHKSSLSGQMDHFRPKKDLPWKLWIHFNIFLEILHNETCQVVGKAV